MLLHQHSLLKHWLKATCISEELALGQISCNTTDALLALDVLGGSLNWSTDSSDPPLLLDVIEGRSKWSSDEDPDAPLPLDVLGSSASVTVFAPPDISLVLKKVKKQLGAQACWVFFWKRGGGRWKNRILKNILAGTNSITRMFYTKVAFELWVAYEFVWNDRIFHYQILDTHAQKLGHEFINKAHLCSWLPQDSRCSFILVYSFQTLQCIHCTRQAIWR